jgi:UDP-N-acetylmuramate dehydrogenase
MVGLAGCPKAEPLKHFLREKLAPAVFLCGLPGDLGGGVVMNAGVGDAITPREFVESVEFVEVMRLAGGRPVIIRLRAEDLQWSYRHCSGWEPGIIVRVGLRWPLGADADVPQRVREATRRRLERQPLQEPSCGSVFKNPVGAKAGALIEQAGLNGLRLGGAQVSEKHANFIVNRGGASAADVDKLIKTVQAEVFRKAGIKLECEVRYLGRWPKS